MTAGSTEASTITKSLHNTIICGTDMIDGLVGDLATSTSQMPHQPAVVQPIILSS